MTPAKKHEDPTQEATEALTGMLNGKRVDRWAEKFGPSWALILVLILVLSIGFLALLGMVYAMVCQSQQQTAALQAIHTTLKADKDESAAFYTASLKRDDEAKGRDDAMAKLLQAVQRCVEGEARASNAGPGAATPHPAPTPPGEPPRGGSFLGGRPPRGPG